MTGWKIRRFWTSVSVVHEADGLLVTLDGRTVRTPGGHPLCLPTRALAEAVADEWRMIERDIDPLRMPFTRLANTVIERVRPQQGEIAAMVATYGETDLLCHRAEGPAELRERQDAGWDPVLDWAADRLGARLNVGTGILPVAQASVALERLAAKVAGMDPFRLGAFHDLVALSGSLVLALAVADRALDAGRAWRLSRIDEDWQIDQWGQDDEAAEAAREKEIAFRRAAEAMRLLDAE